jgi:hypothetical protein
LGGISPSSGLIALVQLRIGFGARNRQEPPPETPPTVGAISPTSIGAADVPQVGITAADDFRVSPQSVRTPNGFVAHEHDIPTPILEVHAALHGQFALE